MTVRAFAFINVLAGDRWVFAGRTVAIGASLVIVQPLPAAAAEITPAAVAAWNRYVAATEATLAEHERDMPLAEPQGRTIDADGATIHEWRGSILGSA
jgi:hypothetical protein